MTDFKRKYPNCTVVPVRDAEHTRYSDLVGIRGHKNYLVNLLSGKITFKRGKIRIPTGCTTIMAAKKVVDEALVLRSGQNAGKQKRKRQGVVSPLISEIWEELMDMKRVEVAPKTMAGYHKSFAYGFGPFWKDKTAKDITEESVMNFRTWYLKNHPTRGFHHTGIHFGMLCRFMVKVGYMDRVPNLEDLDTVDDIVIRNTKREKPGRVATADEIKALLDACKELQFIPGNDQFSTSEHRKILVSRARLGILLGVRCGMRKMEIMTIKREEIDLNNRIIKRWSQKNMKWRLVPFTEEVKEAIEHQLSLNEDSDFLFPMPSDPGRNLSSQVFDKVWVQVKSFAKIKGRFRFHDLRHTFATITGEEGWPPKLACEILDMSLKIYETVYCKPSFRVKAEWMEKTFGFRPKEEI